MTDPIEHRTAAEIEEYAKRMDALRVQYRLHLAAGKEGPRSVDRPRVPFSVLRRMVMPVKVRRVA